MKTKNLALEQLMTFDINHYTDEYRFNHVNFSFATFNINSFLQFFASMTVLAPNQSLVSTNTNHLCANESFNSIDLFYYSIK